MPGTSIDPSKTALLLLDLQPGIIGSLPEEKQKGLLSVAVSAVDTSRKAGARIAYIRAALDEKEFSEVPDHNPGFNALRSNEQAKTSFHPDHPATQVHEAIKPQDGDFQHRKLRFGAFLRAPSNKLLDDFKAHGIDTVVLGGVVTSGAVLSAVRQLSDLDYRLLVVEDLCADHNDEVHKVLLEKVIPKQAAVIKSEELKGLFT